MRVAHVFWSVIKSSGSILSTNSFRLEVQAPEMEVDGLDVSRFIAKATTPDFDALKAAIHTLRRPIAGLQEYGIEKEVDQSTCRNFLATSSSCSKKQDCAGIVKSVVPCMVL